LSYCSGMANVMVMQGREIGEADMGMIRGLLDEHPAWCRSRISVELCEYWDWRNAQGRIKDMAARTLLLKLERAGHVRLPARRNPSPNGRRNRRVEPVAPASQPIRGALCDLRPLSVNVWLALAKVCVPLSPPSVRLATVASTLRVNRKSIPPTD